IGGAAGRVQVRAVLEEDGAFEQPADRVREDMGVRIAIRRECAQLEPAVVPLHPNYPVELPSRSLAVARVPARTAEADERPRRAGSPTTTPPSAFCTASSQSAISRARSISAASPVTRAHASNVPMMYPVVSGNWAIQPWRNEKPFAHPWRPATSCVRQSQSTAA